MIFYIPGGNQCPQCHRQVDAATMVDGDGAPGAGDFSVCLHCDTILCFNGDLSVRIADAADMMRAAKDPETWMTISRLRMVMRAYKKENPIP